MKVHNAYGDSKPGDWTFMMISSWIPDDSGYDTATLQGNEILPDLKQRAKVFGKGIDYMWEAIPDDTRCWHNQLSYWVPEPWDNHGGTITLIGDAAHAMTFRMFPDTSSSLAPALLLTRPCLRSRPRPQ